MQKGELLFMSKVKFIVIGASGYVGKHLKERLSKDYDCIGTCSSHVPDFVKLDLQYPLKFNWSQISYNTIIYFLASISSPDECENNTYNVKKINVTGTCVFIKKAISLGAKVIFFSSDTIYGNQKELFDEKMTANPVGNYAKMKREVEKYFHQENNFKSLRLSYIFSREDKFTRYLIECSNSDKEAVLFDPFDRSVIYREDVLVGVIALAFRWDEFPQQIINFGGPQNLSRVDYVNELSNCNILNDLRYRIEEPAEAFFYSRPSQINMMSPLLSNLLDRKPTTLANAARIEFNQIQK